MKPDLTVVVVVLSGRRTLERCLQALLPQSENVEIIIPYDDTFGSFGEINRDGMEDQIVGVPCPGRRTYAELRAAGVRKSNGQIVALTEDHCIPAADWCDQIRAAHESGAYAAVGGAVEKNGADSILNWSFYLADYVRYSAPEEGPSAHLTDCNVTYRVEVLRRIADVWQEEFHENAVHAALQARGYQLLITPRIVVGQQRSITVRNAIWDRYAFGRLFGSVRAEGLGYGRRLFMAGSTVALPALLVARVGRHVCRTQRYGYPFLKALPWLAVISLLWSVGELAGYLTGAPEAVLQASSKREKQAVATQ